MTIILIKLILLAFILSFAMANDDDGKDWWDRLVSSVREKFVQGGDFIEKEAGPAIKQNFNSAKAKLQDPETHQDIQIWVKEKAIPVIVEKWNQFKGFVNDEIAPEIQKVYEAAAEASEREKLKSTTTKEDN